MEVTTEQRILEVARKHFVSKGYAATRTQDIADEAGINKAMLHYYFRNKEKLYQEITNQTLDQMMPRFAAVLEKDGDFWEKVENIVDTYITMLIKQPDVPTFIMGELSQKREKFIEELKKRAGYFPAMQKFIMQMMTEMGNGNIRQVAPLQLVLSIMGLTIFPFMAKPIFCTIMDLPESDFESLMKERKAFILDFLKRAMQP